MANEWMNGLLGGPYAGMNGGSWVNPWSNMNWQQSYPYQRFGQFMNLYRYPQFPRAYFQDQYAETAATAAKNNQAPPGINPAAWQAQQAQQNANQQPAASAPQPTTWGGLLGAGVTPQTSVGPATYGFGGGGDAGDWAGAAGKPTPKPYGSPTAPTGSPAPVAGGKPVSKVGADPMAAFRSLYSQDPRLAYGYTFGGNAQPWFQQNQGMIRDQMFGGNQDQMNSWINSSSYGNPLSLEERLRLQKTSGY